MPGAPQPADQRERRVRRALLRDRHEELGPCRLDRALRLEEEAQPVHPQGPAHRRGVRTSELLHQPVVPAAAADRRGRAQHRVLGDELERRARVVVDAPHHPGVHPEGDAEDRELALHGLEVGPRLVRERIGDGGRAGEDRLARRVLAVEDPQRVLLGPLLALGAQLAPVRAEEGPERLEVHAAGLRVSERVQLHPDALQPHRAEELHREVDELGLLRRRGDAVGLGAHLPELAVATGLHPLVPEHRAEVPPARHRLALGDRVLDVGPDARRGPFRTEREAATRLVLEGVHLLADDVGRLAHAPDEERGVLHHRGAGLLVPEPPEGLAHGGLERVPHRDVGREEIVHPLHPGDPLAHGAPPMRSPIRTTASATSRSSQTTRPGSKRRMTVEPISKRPSSAPFSTGRGGT